MRPTIWAGSEAAYYTFQALEDKFSLDKEAYASSPFVRQEDPQVDPVFGVDADRKGLSVLQMVGDVPTIKVHGSLVANYRRYHSWFPGEVTSYEAINDALDIVAGYGGTELLMDFNSGGGHVRGVDGVTKMMKRLQNAGFEIHGHSDTLSMSASFWIMSGADRVTGSRMAEFGSIGTMAVVRTFAETEKNMGVKFTVFKEGDFKAIGNPYEALSDSDKAYIKADLKKANGFFLNHVASNRRLELSATDEWAEGKTFYAGDAVKNGLIDQVIDLDDLIGGGASAQTPGDKRIIGMKISPEKLAQIEAGADAKTVLTAAEFKQYEANIADLKTADEAQKKAAQEALDIQAAIDAAGKPATDTPPGDVTKPGATEEGTLAQDYRESLKANGRLEGKVEDLAAKLVEANAKLVEAQAETASMLSVAQHAVSKLQTATGTAREEKSRPSEVVAQFVELQGKMAKMYPTSRQSADNPAPVVEAAETGSEVQSLRNKTLQLQLNQQNR